MSDSFYASAKIYPSMLSADFSKIGEELEKIEQAGADAIHWDVMDGAFVNEITFGAKMIRDHRMKSKLRFDAHLMVNFPERHAENFAQAGADAIIVHAEATQNLGALLAKIKKCEKLAGVAFNPATSVECLEYVSDFVDLILVMTVNPGASGQKFIPSQLSKIAKIRELTAAEICVDGGINSNTIIACANVGANSFVSGSFIFKSQDYKKSLDELKQATVIKNPLDKTILTI